MRDSYRYMPHLHPPLPVAYNDLQSVIIPARQTNVRPRKEIAISHVATAA
jgi:hypothetical protein